MRGVLTAWALFDALDYCAASLTLHYRATKARDLPRPWPLLASLEGRVAFHLHRLRLLDRTLHAARYSKIDAADLAAARLALSHTDVATLARRLRIPAMHLVRSLTLEEQREWAFYRASAANPRHVWAAARAAWSANGITDRDAAHIMHLTPSAVCHALRQSTALTYPPARRLASALKLKGGPEAFLPLPASDDRDAKR